MNDLEFGPTYATSESLNIHEVNMSFIENSSKDNVAFYTALFDINRENVDGRSMKHYVEWLRETVSLFPGIFIFHDGCLTNVKLENARLIQINLAELSVYRFVPHVKKIIKAGEMSAVGDITFKNPLYSIVQYAKFELAAICRDLSNAKSVLWVDAGISRFLVEVNAKRVCFNASILLEQEYEYRFEVDCRSNFLPAKLKLSQSAIGTCKRVFSGTSFWINSNSIDTLSMKMSELLTSWESQNIWDNEQVALRNSYIWRDSKLFIDAQIFKETGSVVRNMSDCIHPYSQLGSKIANFLLNRSD